MGFHDTFAPRMRRARGPTNYTCFGGQQEAPAATFSSLVLGTRRPKYTQCWFWISDAVQDCVCFQFILAFAFRCGQMKTESLEKHFSLSISLSISLALLHTTPQLTRDGKKQLGHSRPLHTSRRRCWRCNCTTTATLRARIMCIHYHTIPCTHTHTHTYTTAFLFMRRVCVFLAAEHGRVIRASSVVEKRTSVVHS